MRFEDTIKSKFDNQTTRTPKSVWKGVEAQLNSDLIVSFQSSQVIYKWSVVAAIFIAILSFAIHYFPTSSIRLESSVDSGKTFNALLTPLEGHSSFYPNPNFGSKGSKILVLPIIIEKESIPNTIDKNVNQELLASNLDPIRSVQPIMNQIDVEAAIYPYIKAYYPSMSVSKQRNDDQKVWAGIEAGAGNFNSIGQTDVANGGINTLNLASAIGSNGFVNPSTNVNPTMNDGIATTVGIDFGMKLGTKWTLESGLAYTNVDATGSASISVLDIYTINNPGFGDEGIDGSVGLNTGSREAPLQIEESYDHEVDLKNNVRFTSIPVKAGYFIFEEKVSLRVNAGLSANYLVSSSLNDPTRGIINTTQSNLYNNWSFDGIGGLEFGYAILKNFDFTIEPNYRYAITPLTNSISSPSRFAIQTGLRYTLK